MKVGVVPTKAGYSAVVLPPFEGDWEIETPAPIKGDVLVQLQGQILQRLAGYCQSLMPWTGKFAVAIPWGAWSIAALALSSIWSYGLKYAVLYGWIRFFFFGDGLFALTQALFHLPSLLRAKKIRKNLAKGEWVYKRKVGPSVLPKRATMTWSEREYIERLRELFPETEPYYKEMLRKEPPQVHRIWPLGLSGWIKRLFLGPKIPLPSLCFELGTDPFDLGQDIPQKNARPVGYILNKTLWFEEPRFAWGELEGLENGVRVLSADKDIDKSKIPMLCHDNVYRPTIRVSAGRRLYFLGRLMLWGVIWLVGMDRPIEDIIGGLYLFFGLPAFLQLSIGAMNRHIFKVLERFKACFYSPDVEIVESPRLKSLYQDDISIDTTRLHKLDEYGFGHLREFLRRVVWQKRWKIPPPTGQGVLDA